MCQLIQNFVLKFCHSDPQVEKGRFQDHKQAIFKYLISKYKKSAEKQICFGIKSCSYDNLFYAAVTILKLQLVPFQLLIQTTVDLLAQTVQVKGSFMQENEYLFVGSSYKRKTMFRRISKINQSSQNSKVKIFLEAQNGKLCIVTTQNLSEILTENFDLIWRRIANLTNFFTVTVIGYSFDVFQIIQQKKYKTEILRIHGEDNLKLKKQHIYLGKMINQLKISHIDYLPNEKAEAETSSFKSQAQKKQQKVLRQFIMNRQHDNFQLNSKKLYSLDLSKALDISEQQISFQIDQSQASLFSSFLKFPVLRNAYPGQIKNIFSSIQIQDPSKLTFKETKLQGGLNRILAARMSYSYIQSGGVSQINKRSESFTDQEDYRQKFLNAPFLKSPYLSQKNIFTRQQRPTILSKLIAIKVPKKDITNQIIAKYEHQKNIVKGLKGLASAYILKYYNSNQAQFQYKNYLLMDFLPSAYTFSDFLKLSKNSLSMHSKLYLLVNLSNAIRFLTDYSIVHMDLNFNNVLIHRDYLIKIIDFGEAYNQFSFNTSFKRGYTLPFCSPEYFTRKTGFSYKQDAFSVGIMMYRLIFQDYPFFVSDKLKKRYKKKSYSKVIFLAPERGEDHFANEQTAFLLYNLFFKLISADENVRCHPSWITILFKILYYHLV